MGGGSPGVKPVLDMAQVRSEQELLQNEVESFLRMQIKDAVKTSEFIMGYYGVLYEVIRMFTSNFTFIPIIYSPFCPFSCSWYSYQRMM